MEKESAEISFYLNYSLFSLQSAYFLLPVCFQSFSSLLPVCFQSASSLLPAFYSLLPVCFQPPTACFEFASSVPPVWFRSDSSRILFSPLPVSSHSGYLKFTSSLFPIFFQDTSRQLPKAHFCFNANLRKKCLQEAHFCFNTNLRKQCFAGSLSKKCRTKLHLSSLLQKLPDRKELLCFVWPCGDIDSKI